MTPAYIVAREQSAASLEYWRGEVDKATTSSARAFAMARVRMIEEEIEEDRKIRAYVKKYGTDVG